MMREKEEVFTKRRGLNRTRCPGGASGVLDAWEARSIWGTETPGLPLSDLRGKEFKVRRGWGSQA